MYNNKKRRHWIFHKKEMIKIRVENCSRKFSKKILYLIFLRKIVRKIKESLKNFVSVPS